MIKSLRNQTQLSNLIRNVLLDIFGNFIIRVDMKPLHSVSALQIAIHGRINSFLHNLYKEIQRTLQKYKLIFSSSCHFNCWDFLIHTVSELNYYETKRTYFYLRLITLERAIFTSYIMEAYSEQQKVSTVEEYCKVEILWHSSTVKTSVCFLLHKIPKKKNSVCSYTAFKNG